MTRPELYMHVGVLSGIVRSAALLLPEDTTDVIARHELAKETDGEEAEVEHSHHRPHKLPVEVAAPATAHAAEVSKLANWRERLHRLCHTLSGVFREHRKEDIRGTSVLIKV